MLLAIWAGLITWQAAEHLRVQKAARDLMKERARYVALTCGRIMRQPGSLLITKERLRPPSINWSGLAKPVRCTPFRRARQSRRRNRRRAPTNATLSPGEMQTPDWDAPVVWLPNLVDLGTNLTSDLIVLTREKYLELFSNAPPPANSNFSGAA